MTPELNIAMTSRFSEAQRAELVRQLEEVIPAARIRSRLIDIVSYAPDAGFYHLMPVAVVLPQTEEEIRALFQFSHIHNVPLTFRAGGTSLSGQSVTDGILADISRYWRKISVEDDGRRVRVQPGITGSMVNAQLKKYHRKIGPDPASISAAMMGGIISNNASGMCCGVALNAYHTIRHVRFMLPSGQVFSTEIPEDYDRFEKECSTLSETLLQLKSSIEQNHEITALIRKKYLLKNTVGYSVNALLDFQRPLDIFAHLLVGAEGTLGFISEAVLETVPDHPYKATGILFYKDIFAACAAIKPFATAGAKAIELMDRASLKSVEHINGIPAIIKTLPPAAAGLLIEFQGDSPEAVQQQLAGALPLLSDTTLLDTPYFSTEAHEQALYWKVRKGMFPSVGAVRARGTTVILEDVAVPVEQLGNAISDLHQLFTKYHYDNAIIFGHAKDGNIHFVVTQAFDTTAEIERYDRFIREVVTLIAGKYQGSLKAEHGTGRNMAPFVETEWGPELYNIMKALKKAADPYNLLNPGVIINDHADAHIQHLKKMPAVEEEVDTCIECGFCEHRCPSRDLTLTPRRRIVVRRALSSLNTRQQQQTYQQLLREYQYDGLETCAVDGLCATACPVDIDTGKLVKRLRKEIHNAFGNKVALFTAKNFRLTANVVKTALQTGVLINTVFGQKAMQRLTRGIRRLIPAFPLWSNQLHAAPSVKRYVHRELATSEAEVVYFPACINQVMGDADPKHHVISNVQRVADKVGVKIYIPKDIAGSCCGQIYSSKGYNTAYSYKANEMIERLWRWSQQGKLPVLIDFSSCVYTMIHARDVLSKDNRNKYDHLQIIDSIQFLRDFVIPRARVINKKQQVVLHPVCSLEKMGIGQVLAEVAGAFAEKVIVPQQAGCCGMAGDRGFLFPELTAAACAGEAAEVTQLVSDGYYSTSKTCEMAISAAVGKNYQSIMVLANETIPPSP